MTSSEPSARSFADWMASKHAPPNDPKFGPTIYLLKLAAGSRIPAHCHKKATETFLFLDGDFTDDGTDYEPGTYFACEPNTVHGPHSTRNGCTLLVFQTAEVDTTDFFLAEGQS